MPIRSETLIHWTGKDIEESSGNDRSCRYVKRLEDYYKNGLYAKRTTEQVVRRKKIKNLVRICFTEIRLSQVETHAKRYGRLGIGFAREFIMRKGGRPVIYIPYDPPADGRLLEASISEIYDKSGHDEDIQRRAKWILAHVKRMSDAKGEPFFEELEWRLVFDERSHNPHFTRDNGKGIHRMPFPPGDVKVIVTPDETVKKLALGNPNIQKYFSVHIPIILTLDECRGF